MDEQRLPGVAQGSCSGSVEGLPPLHHERHGPGGCRCGHARPAHDRVRVGRLSGIEVPVAVCVVEPGRRDPGVPFVWQPGPTMSGLRRPSSVGPRLEKVVIELLSELMAPTTMEFFAVAGDEIVENCVPQPPIARRSFPADSRNMSAGR